MPPPRLGPTPSTPRTQRPRTSRRPGRRPAGPCRSARLATPQPPTGQRLTMPHRMAACVPRPSPYPRRVGRRKGDPMTAGSERRADGVIVVPSEQDDDVVVVSGEGEDEERLVHRPATDAKMPDAEMPDAEMPDAETTGTHATGGDWATIQAQFVDDPRRAVQGAADATSAALDQLLPAARGHD